MGQIKIEISGSFTRGSSLTHEFSADAGGHADCIGRVIEYLVAAALPKAIQLDHALQAHGEVPPKAPFGCGRPGSGPPVKVAPPLGVVGHETGHTEVGIAPLIEELEGILSDLGRSNHGIIARLRAAFQA